MHIVWDWNGTLLNDFVEVVRAANAELARLGAEPLAADDYRARFTRPVRAFNESVLGRALSDEEWELLDQRFHDSYAQAQPRCALAEGAPVALRRAADAGMTQSLLSMAPHDHLLSALEPYDIAHFFVRVDGNTGPAGAPKERSLRRHLQELGLDSADVWLVGDSVDDALAARAVGAQVVLVESGSCQTADLLEQYADVVSTVTQAVDLVVNNKLC